MDRDRGEEFIHILFYQKHYGMSKLKREKEKKKGKENETESILNSIVV